MLPIAWLLLELRLAFNISLLGVSILFLYWWSRKDPVRSLGKGKLPDGKDKGGLGVGKGKGKIDESGAEGSQGEENAKGQESMGKGKGKAALRS